MINELFKQNYDKQNALAIIGRILKSIGQPDFDGGTGIARNFNITNIDYMSSREDEHLLNFSIPEGDVQITCNSEHFDFCIIDNAIPSNFRKEHTEEEILFNFEGDEAKDKRTLRNTIKKLVKNGPDFFKNVEKRTHKSSVMGIRHDGLTYCYDKEIAWLFFRIIALSLNFMDLREKRIIDQIFLLKVEPFRFKDVEAEMLKSFENTFMVLRRNKHNKNNRFYNRDEREFSYYGEDSNIRYIVFGNDSNLFLVAKNTETNILKAWNTMEINPEWFENIQDDIYYPDDSFNLAEYLQDFSTFNGYSKIEYPFEFDHSGYRKSVKTLISGFEIAKNQILYSSDVGFTYNSDQFLNNFFDDMLYHNEILNSTKQLESLQKLAARY